MSYQLRLAELCEGRITGRFLAAASRCFATDELNIILADVYAEVGPAPNLLGIEILHVHRLPFTIFSLSAMFNFLLNPLARLRAVSILEGASLLLLLGVAMPLKYLVHEPGAVRIVGLIHGVLFISYVLLLLQNTIERRWSAGKFGLGLVLSVLPFGAFYAERRLFQPGSAETVKS